MMMSDNDKDSLDVCTTVVCTTSVQLFYDTGNLKELSSFQDYRAKKATYVWNVLVSRKRFLSLHVLEPGEKLHSLRYFLI